MSSFYKDRVFLQLGCTFLALRAEPVLWGKEGAGNTRWMLSQSQSWSGDMWALLCHVPCTWKAAVHLTRLLAMQTCSPDNSALIFFCGRLSDEEMTDGLHFKPLCLLPSMMRHLIPEQSPSFLLSSPISKKEYFILATVLRADTTSAGGRAERLRLLSSSPRNGPKRGSLWRQRAGSLPRAMVTDEGRRCHMLSVPKDREQYHNQTFSEISRVGSTTPCYATSAIQISSLLEARYCWLLKFTLAVLHSLHSSYCHIVSLQAARDEQQRQTLSFCAFSSQITATSGGHMWRTTMSGHWFVVPLQIHTTLMIRKIP